MNCLSHEVALYLYKSTIRPWNIVIIWAGAPNCCLDVLDQLQKRVCRTVVPSFAASLERLVHLRNVAIVFFSMGILMPFYGWCWSEIAELVPFSYSCGSFTPYFDRLPNFSVTIPRCYKDVKDVNDNSFLSRTARLCEIRCQQNTFLWTII